MAVKKAPGVSHSPRVPVIVAVSWLSYYKECLVRDQCLAYPVSIFLIK